MQQNLLEKDPGANLRVYVVWVPRVATDERFGVTDLVVDERAVHYWDEGLVVPARRRRLRLRRLLRVRPGRNLG